jgi:hypothetical protein
MLFGWVRSLLGCRVCLGSISAELCRVGCVGMGVSWPLIIFILPWLSGLSFFWGGSLGIASMGCSP